MSQNSHSIKVTLQTMNNYDLSLYSNLLKNMFISPPPQLIAEEIYVKGGEQMKNGRSRQS